MLRAKANYMLSPYTIRTLKVKHFVGCVCIACCCLVLVFFIIVVIAPMAILGPSEILGSEPMEGTSVGSKCWIPNGREYCAPQFIIAGAMKCGTTSLFAYLLNHPDVLPLRSYELDPGISRPVVAEKEVRFFTDPNWSALGLKYGQEGAVNHYLDLFPEIPAPGMPSDDLEIQENLYKITGEASPIYMCQPGVAKRIYDVLPMVKIIIMLRNPVDRSYSEFWFKQQTARSQVTMETFKRYKLDHEDVFQKCMESEMRLIEFCIDKLPKESATSDSIYNCFREISRELQFIKETDPKCVGQGIYKHFCVRKNIKQYCVPGNVINSLYIMQLPEWLQVFPRSQIMFIKSEEFFRNASKIMQETTEFLGLSSFEWDDVTQTTFNIITEHGKQLGMGETSSVLDKYPTLSTALRDRLLNWFKIHNEKMKQFDFGADFLREWNS